MALKDTISSAYDTYAGDFSITYMVSFINTFFWLVLILVSVWIIIATLRTEADSGSPGSAVQAFFRLGKVVMMISIVFSIFHIFTEYG